MKIKVKRTSDEIWSEYLRVKDMRNNFDENSFEWISLTKYLWKIVERYIDVLLKEML